MIGDFLLRLAVALPLLLLLAVALMLVMKRGLLTLPGDSAPLAPPRTRGLAFLVRQLWPVSADRGRPAPESRGMGRLDLVACRAVLPGLRVLVVRYAGQDLVLGAGPQGLSLLSSLPAPVTGSALPPPPAEAQR